MGNELSLKSAKFNSIVMLEAVICLKKLSNI